MHLPPAVGRDKANALWDTPGHPGEGNRRMESGYKQEGQSASHTIPPTTPTEIKNVRSKEPLFPGLTG